MASKFKIKSFNSLPLEERKKIIYYSEKDRAKGMQQVLDLLKNDIGRNQKEAVKRWINRIEKSLQREYEVIDDGKL